MRSYHAFLVFAAACGDNNKLAVDAHAIDTAPPIDMMIDGPSVTGPHTHYIVDKITVPATMQQAKDLGLDISGDGVVDNKLGAGIAFLASQGFPVQATVDLAIDRGQALLLGDVQAESLSAGAASFLTWKGTNPNPAPCTNAQDMVCRHHLTGTGTFDLAADAIGASILGGAISQNDINTKLLPALATGFIAIIARDCTGSPPPGCGCTAGSTGATVISVFDANHDCAVSAMELQNNPLLQQLLGPDVTINGMPGVSFGVGFTAVKATYTVPGE